MSENKQYKPQHQKNKAGERGNNSSGQRSSYQGKGKGKGKIPNNQGHNKGRNNHKGSYKTNNYAGDNKDAIFKTANSELGKQLNIEEGNIVTENSIFDLFVSQVEEISAPSEKNIMDELFNTQPPVNTKTKKEFVYPCDTLYSIFDEMKKDMNLYIDHDSLTRLIYNIQILKEEDEEDLWDMPDEDEEIDLSKPMDEFFISTEAYTMAKRIFEGEEVYIPEDQKVAVMNALYSMSKASWDNKKAQEKDFDGFTDQIVIDDAIVVEGEEDQLEELQEPFMEEELIREQKEKMGYDVMQADMNEDMNNDDLFTMLHKSSHDLMNPLPMFPNDPYANPLMQAPRDNLFQPYDFFPRTGYFYPEQPMNQLDYQQPFVSSFSTFNDIPYISSLDERPLPEKSRVEDKYSIKQTVEEEKKIEVEPKVLPKIVANVTLKPRCLIRKKLRL